MTSVNGRDTTIQPLKAYLLASAVGDDAVNGLHFLRRREAGHCLCPTLVTGEAYFVAGKLKRGKRILSSRSIVISMKDLTEGKIDRILNECNNFNSLHALKENT